MAVVIESEVWEPNKPLYIFIFVSCFLSIYFSPRTNSRATAVFDHSLSSAFLRFQRSFLLLFSLSSGIEGLWSVFGEYELKYYGMSREQMVLCLCVGCAASLCIGTFLGVLSDLIGQKKVCLLFYMLHLVVAIWKRVTAHPSIWFASICLSVASSIFFFGFETWMVIEHDKLEQRHDTLNDMFWLMTFLEAASHICSQVLGNFLVGRSGDQVMFSLYNAAMLLAIVSFIYTTQRSEEAPRASTSKDYWTSFWTYVLADKRIWLLSWSQACLHLSIAVFWVLWAPTIIADGREVQLGFIYPCLLGAKMLGSTAFPWFLNGPLPLRTEECLIYFFCVMGVVLSIVAYDYQVLFSRYYSRAQCLRDILIFFFPQDIGILMVLFCLFHASAGLVLPSLARLRSMYVPNELRGGMMSLSQAPANIIFLFFLVQRGYYQKIGNSTIIAFAAVCLFSAAGCMYMLKQSGKQLHHNWHKL